MKPHSIIIIFGLTVGLFGCNSSADGQVMSNNKIESYDSITLTKTQVTENEIKQEQGNDCVRGQAEPVIQKTDYPNTTFVLQPDSITAIETVTFDNGDRLVIRNWGCEYYVLTFRFETSRFNADTTILKYWYVTAVKLLNEVKHGIDAPIDIDKGTQALNKYISKCVFDLELQKEIDFGGGDIRRFVTIDRIEKIDKKKFSVTISFATGPL